MVPYASSPVTCVLRWPLWKTMRKTKRLRRRLDETFITLGSKCCYRWYLYRNFCSFYCKVTKQVPYIVLQQSKKVKVLYLRCTVAWGTRCLTRFKSTIPEALPLVSFCCVSSNWVCSDFVIATWICIMMAAWRVCLMSVSTDIYMSKSWPLYVTSSFYVNVYTS